jgi:hypothetical protein
MPNQPFQVSPWAMFFLLISPIWLAIPACTGDGAQIQVEAGSTEARTVKSRRKQRLRQQRCEQEVAKLQTVQGELARHKKLVQQGALAEANPKILELEVQEKKLTATVQNCQQIEGAA